MTIKWGVDEIIEVPQKELVVTDYVQNKDYQLEKKPKGRGKIKSTSRKISEDFSIHIPEPYMGFSNLLVRTALIRSNEYSDKILPDCSSPRAAAHLCKHAAYYDQEHIIVLALNERLKLVAIHETAIGGRSGAGAARTDVLKVPFLTSSLGCILIHNHPSGDMLPSKEDLAFFHAVKESASCLQISVMDSLIVAARGYYSLSEEYPMNWD